MPADGDLAVMTRRVGKRRGRSIKVIEKDLSGSEISGLWIEVGDVDYVVIAAGSPPARRAAILCHELAHMLLGHSGRSGNGGVQVAATIAPDIAPHVAARFLARDEYDDAQEVEAESLGTLLCAEHHRRLRDPQRSPDILTARLR
ncbi:ImmA/IrrE family metallo-endopeptidase [Solicola sp. PLA-1-18]|uniref:ImmA/IrrE family metallo-endopeptidase n=1 Tax=Solicola sp. PLA-1-18 TaxID=3380532 RepID=UPI003B7DC69C